MASWLRCRSPAGRHLDQPPRGRAGTGRSATASRNTCNDRDAAVNPAQRNQLVLVTVVEAAPAITMRELS